ncbi:MAG: hypothetical protein R3350_09615, partial [Saprospiraceae bacterium]|nr:hypothetical protein [Saprospiraceae bacterium]
MRLLLISCFCFFLLSATAQEEAPKNWSLGGYVKNLQGLFFFNRSFPDPRTFRLVDTFLMDHLIHQRLNFRYFGGEHIRFTAELRSRIFYGDLVRLNPDFGRQVGDANDDFFDLSLTLLDESAWLIHTMLDRLYVEYISGDWELRLGRQRINWGIGSVWNPNDIFNAFSFTDFDYEERPGTDALRVRYYTGFASSLELAVRVADRLDETTIAGLWKFHRGNYDFQLLSGYDRGHWALGGGWAGSIKKA